MYELFVLEQKPICYWQNKRFTSPHRLCPPNHPPVWEQTLQNSFALLTLLFS